MPKIIVLYCLFFAYILFIFCKQRFKFCQIFLYFNTPCQGWGGGVSYGLFILHTNVACRPWQISCQAVAQWLTYEVLQRLEVSQCPCLAYCNKIMSVLPNFFQLCLCCDHEEALKARALKIHPIWKFYSPYNFKILKNVPMVGDFLGFSNCRGFF